MTKDIPSDPRQTVLAFADQLRQYAEHFVQRDWNYTRNLGSLTAIKRNDPYDRLTARVARAARALVRRDPLARELGVPRWAMLRASLRRDRHLPDGVLENAGVITYWEETGEYLQYVQPSVGSLLADLMEAHPGLPEVHAIAAEMKRINDAYGERLAEEAA